MINFACVYYGNKYSFPYVKNLHNMVERNLTIPHKFICFTDNTVIAQRKEFRRTNIEFRQFKRHDFNGWFNKLQLFSPDSNLDGNINPNINMNRPLDINNPLHVNSHTDIIVDINKKGKFI